jgi:hypothetical protein
MGGVMTEQHSVVPTQDPDLMLIRAMAAGNTHALDSLYARYGPPVLSFLVARLGDRQLAEEILQDVMLAAWNSAATFRGESRVYTWLLVIARNRAMNAQRRHTPVSVPLDEELGDYNGDSGLFEGLARKVTGRRYAMPSITCPPSSARSWSWFFTTSFPVRKLRMCWGSRQEP